MPASAPWRRGAPARRGRTPDDFRSATPSVRITLLATSCWTRQTEITDALVDVLISLIATINTRAERRVEGELLTDLRRVRNKEGVLFALAQAALEHPDDTVRDALYPVVGESILRDLTLEAKANQRAFRSRVRTVLSGSYTRHYRRMMPQLLAALKFESHNSGYRPVIEALDLLSRYADKHPRIKTLERTRIAKDIDYIVIYKLSRMARNRIDDAIVMADLRKRGVTLVSATESIDATPVGQLMHGILAAFNEYRSREDGADIAYKMGEKAKKGGTIGKAPIGYLNTIERVDGREVRSVTIDAQRGPYIKLAFELYAAGNKSLDDISGELTDRGLTTKATTRRPAGPISISKLSAMFRDRYYLGEVTYKQQSYPGRHEALVTEELFNRVNDLLDSRGVSGERRRVHHQYLKCSFFCGRCWQEDGTVRRMIIQRAIGRSGQEYYYFFCRGVQDKSCHARYANLDRVEDAVTEHYRTIQFSPAFIDRMTVVMQETLSDSESAQRLLKQQLEDQLKALEAKRGELARPGR